MPNTEIKGSHKKTEEKATARPGIDAAESGPARLHAVSKPYAVESGPSRVRAVPLRYQPAHGLQSAPIRGAGATALAEAGPARLHVPARFAPNGQLPRGARPVAPKAAQPTGPVDSTEAGPPRVIRYWR